MNSGSDHLFSFTGFSPATFLSPVSDSSVAAALQKPRRKRSKLVKSPADGHLAPSSSGAGISKPKHAKKPDQTAPKITRPCTECGKQFWSWKALFGHMRCHPERQWRGINPPPNLRRLESTAAAAAAAMATDEDREIAACLIMLANGRSPSHSRNAIDRIEAAVTETVREIKEAETTTTAAAVGPFVECPAGPPPCRFECSGCKKVFGSHQALGGHRASHKNVKGCFAAAGGGGSGGETAAESQCSVCVKAFSRLGYLDLNLPPPMEDIEESSSSLSSEIGLDLRLGLNLKP